MQLYLIRGVPGSGKSTLARIIQGSSINIMAHYEADQYFMENGQYNFNPAYLRQAHLQCFRNTKAALESGRSVVVANTFTTKKEMREYFELAKEFSVRPLVITCNSGLKSVHNVPEEAMERMIARFDNTAQDELFNEYFPKGL